MSDPATPPVEPVRIVLVRKLILLSLLMVVAALALTLLLRNIRVSSLLLPQILSDATMGLIAGLSARWVLHKLPVFLRIISALAFLIGGLELLGWFTAWQVGLGLLKFGYNLVDWYNLGQLLLGTGIVLLALYAWVVPNPTVVRPAPGPKSVKQTLRTRKPPKKRPRRVARPRVQPLPATVAEQPIQPKQRRIVHRKSQLRLSDEVEHRCPYCLELIIPNDPRGTVECKICHTLHHADCWAITGACQVPHYTV
jgi:hypothetical protein